jgi:hypothetical protein
VEALEALADLGDYTAAQEAAEAEAAAAAEAEAEALAAMEVAAADAAAETAAEAAAAAAMATIPTSQLPRLRSWLRGYGLGERAAALEPEDGVLVAWRDGLLLVRLVETLEGRELEGIQRQPRAAAHCRRNVEKALEALRGRKTMKLTHLYSAPRIVRGDPSTILPLLVHMRDAYGGVGGGSKPSAKPHGTPQPKRVQPRVARGGP